MNLGELCADVYTLTGRPDLVADTQLAIRHATQKFHLHDFWLRDHEERRLDFSASSQNFQINIPSTFTNWRKFDYIRPYDQTTGTPSNKLIRPIAPSNIFDEFNRQKSDIYYVSGNLMNMRTLNAENGFLIGWYKYPNTMPNNYSSWIADMYSAIIVEEAAGRILQAIGMVDEGNKFVDPQKGSVYHPITGHLVNLTKQELEPNAR